MIFYNRIHRKPKKCRIIAHKIPFNIFLASDKKWTWTTTGFVKVLKQQLYKPLVMIQQIVSLKSASFFQFGICIVMCWSIVSCRNFSQGESGKREKVFFDLQSYFQSEIQRLNTHGRELKKEVVFNGLEETHNVELTDFSPELKLFTESDINRSALTDKYRPDSMVVDDQLDQLLYTALDSSLNVRKIIIDFEEGKIVQIDIFRKQKNIVSFSQQHLRYQPQKGYTISSLQKTIFSKPKKLVITTYFQQ